MANRPTSATAESEEESLSATQAIRYALNFFEKYDRYECQELLAYQSTHWMLSTDDFKIPTEPPVGLVANMPVSGNNFVLLIPEDGSIAPMDYREVHQIIRELTMGIFAMNQLPTISLEANFDQSTSVQLPPAYQDTRVGQILLNIDYMMKALWHGAYFPKEKRTKFSERWRTNLDVNANGHPETKKPLITEFATAGLMDITKDPDFTGVYDSLPVEQPGDADMNEERRFFMSHVDNLSMQITAYQKTIQQYKSLFLLDSDWLVSSVVRMADDKIDNAGYERLHARLQLHNVLISENLQNKAEIKRQLHLLKFISFLVPFLVGLKKRMRVPDIGRLMAGMMAYYVGEFAGDDTKTERELPPLMLPPDYKCKNFSFGSHYFHLHGGIQIDLETDETKDLPESIIGAYDKVTNTAAAGLNRVLDPELPFQQDGYPLPVMEIDKKRYYALMIDCETYYPQPPQKPRWVLAMQEEIMKVRPKRLPLSDIHVHEQFKKYFGYKRAILYKNLPNGLKMASIRGLIAMFQTLCRKCPASRLGKQDEVGLSLVHHAAMNNRPQIIAFLILQSMDINVRRNNNILSTGFAYGNARDGPTPLHLAARCGSLDAVACLTANYANILSTDQDGLAPIHYAAYYNQVPVIRSLLRKNDALLELQTKNDLKQTPLLLAASSGALSCVQCLISMGAYILRRDDAGNNIVHLAALRFHTNVLEFFIGWHNDDLPVWEILVGMLKDPDVTKKDSAVKCLEVLSTSEGEHWQAILDADGVPALVELLKLDSEEIQSVACSVLCNISEHDPIRRALTKAKAAPILIQLLSSPMDDIQSRASIVLSDLACVDDNQHAIAADGGIPALVNLLDSELEDVLVNAVNAIRVLCIGNPENQTAVARAGGADPLVEFLTVHSDILQAASSAAIAALTSGHPENQNMVVAEGAVRPLVNLVKGRNISVEVKAASALEALAQDNYESQKAFLELDAPKALNRLLKIWSMEVKEQGACSLWALAGQTKTQQKYIAERIGIQQLIEMLLLKSEKLQYVGCMAMIALGRENMDSQNKIADEGGIQPLVRLLRSQKTSERVLLTVIRTLGTLCVGVAYRNNKVTQKKIAEEQAIPALVQILVSPPSREIQVEVACTLGCIILGHTENQEKLREEPDFKFDMLLRLLASPNKAIQLKAGTALAIFAFNNTAQQYAMREAGGIRFRCFQQFLESEDEVYQCHAAFQMVVLARVIIDVDQVSLSAKGVTTLVHILKSKSDQAVILAASLLSSLAHTRAGIPDAMVTSGAIELLVDKLISDNDQVRFTCAVALGYLSYNRTAARILLTSCRNTPGLFDQIMDNIGPNPKISPDFTDDFRRAKIVGLPCLSLECNGGPPAVPESKKPGSRPHTSHAAHRKQENQLDFLARITSAPAAMKRAQSAKVRGTTPTTTVAFSVNKKDSDSRLKSAPFKTNFGAWNKDRVKSAMRK